MLKMSDLLSKARQQTEGSFGILNHTVSPCQSRSKFICFKGLPLHALSFPTHSLKNKTWGWKRLQNFFPRKKFQTQNQSIYFIHITGGPETAPGSELGLASVEPSLRSGDVAAVEGRLPRKSWKKSTSSDLGEPRKVVFIGILIMVYETCEGGERKPARVFSVKPARKMISNIDYPIISHLSNMPTFFWAKTRQIRGADTPRGRNVPGKEAGQRQTKWHTVWCAISICHTWPRR